MLSIYRDEDRELIEMLKEYNRRFQEPIIDNETISDIEQTGGVHLLGFPSIKDELKKMIEKALKTNIPIQYPDDILKVAGFDKETIELIKKGDIHLDF